MDIELACNGHGVLDLGVWKSIVINQSVWSKRHRTDLRRRPRVLIQAFIQNQFSDCDESTVAAECRPNEHEIDI